MKADPSNAVGLHTASKLHDIKWEEFKVIDQESKWWRKRIKEAIYIKETFDILTQTLDFYLTQPGTAFYKGHDIITLSTFETV